MEIVNMFTQNNLFCPENKTTWRLPKTIAFVSLVLLSSKALAQNNTVSSGGVASGSNGTVSYSVGQVFYNFYMGDNGKLLQGLQQPYEVSVITGTNDLQINLKVAVYPNPVFDYLTLTIQHLELSQFSYQLLDIQGKILNQEKLRNSITNIKMESLNNGIYFLKILNKQKQLKTYKIIKAK